MLALQGAVREHLHLVGLSQAEGEAIKTVSQLEQVDGLIIPGGESTTIGKLMDKYGFIEPITDMSAQGVPVYGTCAGLILLAKKVVEGSEFLLDLMDIEVRRNAFGRQRESFEEDLEIRDLGEKPFHGIFIRAPWIDKVGHGVEVMAKVKGKIVMARQGHLLVTAFHPELTKDTRLHKYFVEMVAEKKK